MSEEIIEIKDFAYNPASKKIKAGDKVTWKNFDDVEHSVTFDNEEYPEGELEKDENFSLIMDQKGTFSYYCRYHPQMQAEIIVE